jgi:hypothetical protein
MPAKLERCIRSVRKQRGAANPWAVCTAIRKRNRREQVVLYAQAPGGPVLKFVGKSKFARRGKAFLFDGAAQANLAAFILRDSFPVELGKYKLWAK